MQLFGLAERGDFARLPAVKPRRLDWASRVLHAGVKQRDHGLTEAMQVEADSAVEAMKQGLGVLDTIVTMAPLLGILGTVLGIIESFDLLGASGIEDPKAVTGGIAQALITTAAGLAIALVTLVPLNYFIGRTERAVRRLQQIATHFEVAYRRGQGRSD
jgi:biopolymer transport protein ExbB